MAIYGSYSEIYDMNTVDDNISALKFHSPQDGAPVEHLGGLFAQFRKFKYLGADMALIPAQQLPLDPLQVTSVDGDGMADPRDVLNPILYKHWNGERTMLDNYLHSYYTTKITGTGGIGNSVGPDRTEAMGQSIDEVEIPILNSQQSEQNEKNATQFYAMQLMDNSFQVSGVQTPLRIKMRPKVWDVQAQRPMGAVRTGSFVGAGTKQGEQHGGMNMGQLPGLKGPQNPQQGPQTMKMDDEIIHGRIPAYLPFSPQPGSLRGLFSEQEFLTSGIRPMGWLPTNNTFSGIGHKPGEPISELSRVRLPKIYMQLMILPEICL
uniref:Capsid protein n=1 Tax=Pygoscelis antarcticus TaxID=79643 RepID=A0A7G7LKQ0_PYGAN|nr:capsid protein [Pygoscelis antarcticus]